jgi:DNA repair protein RecO (recombination protein O)
LLAGDWDSAVSSDERQRREAAGLTAAFVQYHLERGLRSLRLVDREPPDGERPRPRR